MTLWFHVIGTSLKIFCSWLRLLARKEIGSHKEVTVRQRRAWAQIQVQNHGLEPSEETLEWAAFPVLSLYDDEHYGNNGWVSRWRMTSRNPHAKSPAGVWQGTSATAAPHVVIQSSGWASQFSLCSGFGSRAEHVRWSNPLRILGNGSEGREEPERETLNFLLIQACQL